MTYASIVDADYENISVDGDIGNFMNNVHSEQSGIHGVKHIK